MNECRVCKRPLRMAVEREMGLCASCAQEFRPLPDDPMREIVQRDAQRMADSDFYYGARRTE